MSAPPHGAPAAKCIMRTPCLKGSIWIAVAWLVAAPQGGAVSTQAEEQPGGAATLILVNGEPITDRVLRITDDTVRAKFSISSGRAPDVLKDAHELRDLRQQLESKALARAVRVLIKEQQVRRFGIHLSEEDLRERWKSVSRNIRPVEDDRARAKARALCAGLSAVYDAGEDAEAVYSRELALVLSREEWQSHLERTSSPVARAQMRASLESNEWTFEEGREVIRQVLTDERLSQAIDVELIRSDPAYAEYVRLAAGDPPSPTVAEKGPQYRRAKQHEWWRARYREAQIEVLDARFQSVPDHIAE